MNEYEYGFTGDTPFLMHNGTISQIKNIKNNDTLMALNGKPMQVTYIIKKTVKTYYIYPIKGTPYTVSENHILLLKVSCGGSIKWAKYDNAYSVVWLEKFSLISKSFSVGTYKTKINAYEEAQKYFNNNIVGNKKYRQYGDIVEISVGIYVTLSKTLQNHFKGFTMGIDFKSSYIDIDPYALGYWLGDGHSWGTGITTTEPEIVEYFKNFAGEHGLMLKRQPNSKYDYDITSGKNFVGNNPFLTFLKKNNLIKNKHIPDQYKFNSRENRLELLAGLIDSDGHYANGYYDFIFKSEKLADDVIFLARSLGYNCYKSICQKTCTNSSRGRITGTYYRFSICGEGLKKIPSILDRKMARKRAQKKNASVTGLNIFYMGKQQCYELKTNLNGPLLLDDLTLVHK